MLCPDLPITKSDDDVLNRGSFAESLAKTIVQYSSPSSLAIGLYGRWGSGKTSLLNMSVKKLVHKLLWSIYVQFFYSIHKELVVCKKNCNAMVHCGDFFQKE